MFRRRPLLRAAVVGGGAYMAGKSAARRRDAEADQDGRISQLEQQDAAGQGAAPASAAGAGAGAGAAAQSPVPSQRPAESSMPEQLDRLATLHQQGALTDDEFTAAKARLLGS